MKISNSKKELAKIINENGGWRDGADSCSCDNDGYVNFFKGGPTRNCGSWLDNGDCEYLGGIITPKYEKIKNWHQTILSRAEYFHLYPEADADGWIEWKGGECPVDGDCEVSIRFRGWGGSARGKAKRWSWGYSGCGSDITSYRLRKPEQARSQTAGDNGGVVLDYGDLVASIDSIKSPDLRANLAMIYAPSIESLAADYRNKLDYADRKQDEADKANMESGAALSELEKAIAAIGFAITPICAVAQEPELVITNRGQLELDDVIWISECRPKNDMPGGEYRVVKVGTIGVEFNGVTTYPDFSVRSWRFIRRPAK